MDASCKPQTFHITSHSHIKRAKLKSTVPHMAHTYHTNSTSSVTQSVQLICALAATNDAYTYIISLLIKCTEWIFISDFQYMPLYPSYPGQKKRYLQGQRQHHVIACNGRTRPEASSWTDLCMNLSKSVWSRTLLLIKIAGILNRWSTRILLPFYLKFGSNWL